MPLILNGTTGVSGVDGSAGTPSYQGNDSNTGIFYPAADTIAFAEGGTEVMRIDSSGNVGIGTSTPSTGTLNKQLTINSGANSFAGIVLQNNATGTAFNDGFQIYLNGTTGTFSLVENSPMTFEVNGSERMRIDSAGRVQIGAANPATSTFSVQGSSGTSTVAYFGSSNTNLTAMAVRNSPSDNTTMLSSEWSTTATNLLLGIGGTERLRINPTGNVLIGDTVDRSSKFYVSNQGSGSLIALFNGDNGGGNSDGIVHTYQGAGLANYRVKIYMNTYNGVIDMRNSSNVDTVRIAASGDSYFNNGNFLVGATSYVGGGANNSGVTIFNANNTAGRINIGKTFSGNAAAMQFTHTGTEVGSITYSNTGAAYISTSDYRLKENIAPMTGALAKVQALKPVTYNWKSDGSEGQGFIAHELQAVVPDAVSGEKDAVNEDGSIKPQGIDTSFLVATLTAAIQEQQAMIEELKQEVAKLKGV